MRRTHADVDRRLRAAERLVRLLWWLRRLALVVAVIFVALIFRWYDFERLADAQWEALSGKVRRGAFLVFATVDADTQLGVGSLVEASVDVPPALAQRIGRDRGVILSVIRGLPGSVVTFERAARHVEIRVDGEDTGAVMELSWQRDVAATLRVREGPIPDGHYLLINPAVDAEAVDSRKVGLIPRAAMTRKASYL